MIKNYVDILDPQSKEEYKEKLYYIAANCLIKLKEVNLPVNKLFNPSNKDEYFLLKLYLLTFLDIISEIHENSHECNSFSYEYIINWRLPKLDNILIVCNENSPNIHVKEIKLNEFEDFVKQNKLAHNLSGAFFYRQDYKKGVVYDFLINRLNMRKEYKKLRNEVGDITSEKYKFYDRRQNACKINANSAYGLTGMADFRFSNKMLAKSTTVTGRFILKLAQIVGENYLEEVQKEIEKNA